MPRLTLSLHWSRMAAGAAMLVAGAAILIARPGTALAHHAEVSLAGDCAGWTTKAEYIGGIEDRKVVVDVVVNGEQIQQTFFFDNAPGHLGHQDYWLLYERSGAGSLQTSGTVTLFSRAGGVYSVVDNTAIIEGGFACQGPTPTATSEAEGTVTPLPTDTPQRPPTDTPEPPATETAVPTTTNTPEPTPTEDITIDGTVTPLPSDTPVPSPTATHTPASEPTNTPVPTNTPPSAAPTFISTVEAAVPPNQPPSDGPPSSRQTPPEEPEGGDSGFPRSGYGAQTPANGLAAGVAGLMLAAGGLVVMGVGLRRRA